MLFPITMWGTKLLTCGKWLCKDLDQLHIFSLAKHSLLFIKQIMEVVTLNHILQVHSLNVHIDCRMKLSRIKFISIKNPLTINRNIILFVVFPLTMWRTRLWTCGKWCSDITSTVVYFNIKIFFFKTLGVEWVFIETGFHRNGFSSKRVFIEWLVHRMHNFI